MKTLATLSAPSEQLLGKETARMSSSEEYLKYVLDLLRDVSAVTHKKMMGEYLLYSDGVLFGGIYDDRFLLKDAPAARSGFPLEETPYEGAKPMLLVDSEDATRIAEVVEAMRAQLPAPKKETVARRTRSPMTTQSAMLFRNKRGDLSVAPVCTFCASA